MPHGSLICCARPLKSARLRGRVVERWWREIVFGQRRGAGAGATRAALAVASLPYVFGLKANLALYEWRLRRRTRPSLPTVSIGNITLGGTGKTTATRRLARDLAARDVTAGIVLRGHGRRARDWWRWASLGSGLVASPEEVGDEAAMLAHTVPGAPIAVGKRREHVIDKLKDEIDDGFQYFRMERCVDLVLIDATFDLASARVFPRGYLREPLSHLRRATHLLITHSDLAPRTHIERIIETLDRHAPDAPIMLSRHAPVGLYPLDTPEQTEPAAELAGRRVVVMCAIGNPSSFEGLLLQLGSNVVARAIFPDHHYYRPEDWAQVREMIRGKGAELIVVTEKDAVKLPPAPAGIPPVAAVAVDMEITDNSDAWRAMVELIADVAQQESAAAKN